MSQDTMRTSVIQDEKMKTSAEVEVEIGVGEVEVGTERRYSQAPFMELTAIIMV